MVSSRFTGYMPSKEKESSFLPDELQWELPLEKSGETIDGPDAAEAKGSRGGNESPVVAFPNQQGRKRLGADQRAQSVLGMAKASPSLAANGARATNSESVAVEAIVPTHSVRMMDAVVPRPVITVNGPREPSHSAAALSDESRFKPARRDHSVPNSERHPAALMTYAPHHNEPSVREAAGDFPAFDPSRAYPNAPLARPFAGGSHQLTIRTGIREAHTWRFRIGTMICPVIGATLALPVGLARLPSGLWIAVAACMLVGAVSPLVLLHRAWTCINDGGARTSPRRAVGLLIVPIFNVYWMFHVVPGFATDFNRFIERHQIEARPLSRNLILAAMVPLIGIVFRWGVIADICDSINCVRRSHDLEIDVKE